MEHPITIVIGGSSAIGRALVQSILSTTDNNIIIISRDINALVGFFSDYETRLQFIQVEDYKIDNIERAVSQIGLMESTYINKVFICNGILHSITLQPEKKIEDLSVESFNEIMTANTLVPMLWIQKLSPLLSSKLRCQVVVFSARVGSITDNRLGGWYTYRASKATLNMMLKTTAIEFKRRYKNIKLVSFHPGTTDTLLSKPFQSNVPKNKLFKPEFVSQQLLNLLKTMEPDGQLTYMDWEGKLIDW